MRLFDRFSILGISCLAAMSVYGQNAPHDDLLAKPNGLYARLWALQNERVGA